MAEALHLKVAEVAQQDVGLGTARIDERTRQRLKVGAGDIVEVRGRKVTPAIVAKAIP